MNPLAMKGPYFLAFYLVAAAVLYLLLRHLLRKREAALPLPPQLLSDAYEIGMLRAGWKEAIRLAVVSLIDRGLLEAEGSTVSTKPGRSVEHARRPLEKAILDKCAQPGDVDALFEDDRISATCSEYLDSLRGKNLLHSHRVRWLRLPLVAGAVGAGLLLAGMKISVAISRGKANYQFLVLLAVLFTMLALAEYFRNRTGLGDRVMKDLRILFQGRRNSARRMRAGGQTNEAILLAAVFGLDALEGRKGFAFIDSLFPRPKDNGGSSTCSSTYSTLSTCGGGGSDSGSSSGGGGCGGCGGGGD